MVISFMATDGVQAMTVNCRVAVAFCEASESRWCAISMVKVPCGALYAAPTWSVKPFTVTMLAWAGSTSDIE